MIVAAFGDPGRAELAAALHVPVVGIGEASMLEASKLSDGRFAVASTIAGLSSSIRQLAEASGCGAGLVSVLAPAGDAHAIMADARETEEVLATLIAQAIDKDKARAVVIGGGPLAKAARALAPRFAYPIVEPIPVAIATTVARLGVSYCGKQGEGRTAAIRDQ